MDQSESPGVQETDDGLPHADAHLEIVDDNFHVHDDDWLANGRRHVPVNLRQSGNSDARMLISTRVRKSPYWHRSEQHGCYAYSVYNHMYHPRAYVRPEDGGLLKEYEYLTNDVTMWNVAVERQIRIKGPDALSFADHLVTRDLINHCPVYQARYVILCNEHGGIINDPVLLRVAEDEIWLSISDSDVCLWAQGVNYAAGYDVSIGEIDVCPVQIQGPKSRPLMEKLFGPMVNDIPYYNIRPAQLGDMRVLISRTGFSAEVGYEIYLYDATARADQLWDTVIEAGREFNLQVIAPSHIRRLEAGILSYGQDMDLETNPFEVGLDRHVHFAKPDFIGKQSLLEIRNRGLTRKLVGLRMEGAPIDWYIPDFWPVHDPATEQSIGYVSSAFYSPKLGFNIAFAMLQIAFTGEETVVEVMRPGADGPVSAHVCRFPFFDPAKELPKG